MGIRIQPREIEIPGGDPFKYDLLGRKESITTLTHIIRSIDGPCVLAVDAPWGAGKTTFLKIWEQHLRNEEFTVVSFNAWETDFSNDPFIALSDSILHELEGYKETRHANKIKIFGELAMAVTRIMTPALIKATTGGAIDVSALLELDKEIRREIVVKAPERTQAYREARELLEGLRSALQDVAQGIAASNDGLPLVVVIDELDRCRPSYAVELLETAKHVFAVDQVVFVLAVNRSELAHSVCSLYGSEFDALGYLNRFFDVDFRLPDPSRRGYLRTALKVTLIEEYLENIVPNYPYPYHPPITELLEAFYGVPALSIRTVAQAIHRLGLILASERTYRPLFVVSAVVALIVRSVDPELYQRFIKGELDDSEVVDSIFDRPEYANVSWRIKAHFDAVLIVAAWELSYAYYPTDEVPQSPLLERYREMIEQQQQERPTTEMRLALEVLNLAKVFSGDSIDGTRLRFGDAARRLELLSTEVAI